MDNLEENDVSLNAILYRNTSKTFSALGNNIVKCLDQWYNRDNLINYRLKFVNLRIGLEIKLII